MLKISVLIDLAKTDFLKLKLINSYLKSIMSQLKLNQLVLLSIEKIYFK